MRFPNHVIPEAKIHPKRGRGRNDDPVRCVWNAILAGVVYQHDTIEKLRRELHRNAELRQMCGFDVFLGSESVPKAETFSRFFRKLIEHSEAIDQIFEQMVEEIGKEIPLIARSSYQWAREYRHRTDVECVNSRLDVSFGFEQHTIRGMAKMKARVGIALIVMLAMALGHIKEKRREMMRSLVRSPTQHLMKKAA